MTDTPRRRAEPIDGLLLLNKPAGLTSNQALQREVRPAGLFSNSRQA